MQANIRFIIVLVLLSAISCNNAEEKTEMPEADTPDQGIEFNSKKWQQKQRSKYPYREEMLADLTENEEYRKWDKAKLLDQLGKPDYYGETDSSYFYYTVKEKKFGLMTLNATTLVIKLTENDSIEWMKIHE